MTANEEHDQPQEDFGPLLAFVKESRGFDFTGYKRNSLNRRIHKRMAEVGVGTPDEYRDLLESRPEEFTALFNTVLINVTSFLRDREAWDYLAATVLPAILSTKGPDDPIRVWSAGCASGEEAYTLAVLLCDSVGEERFRHTVKIYATDVDEEALVAARHANYPSKDVHGAFTDEQIRRYFEESEGFLSFRKDLRRSVIFGRHDLVQDPPISRVDLLVCRNTLMYFTAETQRHVLANLHFALTPHGYLFLGKSEALINRTDLFVVEDVRYHVFSKRAVGHQRPTRPALTASVGTTERLQSLLESAVEASPLAQIIVDADQRVVAANRHARSLFGIGVEQVGVPFRDLQVSYRPAELRSVVDEVLRDWRQVTVADVEYDTPSGAVDYLDIHIVPIGGDPRSGGVVMTFMEVGRYRALKDELERSQRDLETAYEELQSTVEELETTNEELQSTNEELETTNEELHSTNEELETMNEELQSTNEELETINRELQSRTSELDDVNSFLESILSSLAFGVAVLDRQMAVQVWNRQAEELWGLRAGEVEGQHFLNLDIGLPVDELRGAVRRCLAGQSEIERQRLNAVNRRGRPIVCDVTVLPQGSGEEPMGVIVLMQVVTDSA